MIFHGLLCGFCLLIFLWDLIYQKWFKFPVEKMGCFSQNWIKAMAYFLFFVIYKLSSYFLNQSSYKGNLLICYYILHYNYQSYTSIKIIK